MISLSFFGPKFLEDGSDSMDEDKRIIKKENIKVVFGISITVAGVVGVPLGMILSTTLKRKYSRADPIICGVAVLASSVFLGICLLLANINIIACLVFIFIGTLRSEHFGKLSKTDISYRIWSSEIFTIDVLNFIKESIMSFKSIYFHS